MKKKIICFLLVLCSLDLVYGQSSGKKPQRVQRDIDLLRSGNENFITVRLFTNPISKYEEGIGPYIQFGINDQKLRDVFNANYKSIRLLIPRSGNGTISVLLTQHKIHSDDFEFTITDAKGQHKEKEKLGRYYYGVVENEENTVAAISIFEDEVAGVISNQAGNWNLGKKKELYVYFNDHEFQLSYKFKCGNTPGDKYDVGNKYAERTNGRTDNLAVGQCMKVFIDCGSGFYNYGFASSSYVQNKANSIFNVDKTIYYNDGIDIINSQMNIWTSSDPFDYSTSNTMLTDFSNYWKTRTWNGNVASLWTQASCGVFCNPRGGRAWVNRPCHTDESYNVNDFQAVSSVGSFPTYSWSVNVTSHELGHNLGSPHTHDCEWNGNKTAIDGCGPTYDIGLKEGSCAIGPLPSSGTIMSYCHLLSNIGVNFSNGFGAQVADTIRTRINQATCLKVCTSCNDYWDNSGQAYNMGSGENKTVWAVTGIYPSGGGTVNSGGSLTFKAGVYVNLTPGFEVKQGGTFSAVIGCPVAKPAPSYASKNKVLNFDFNTEKKSVSISPNPFTNSFTLNLKLEQNSRVSVRLYDMMGKQIATIIDNQQKQKGTVQLPYNNSKLVSGTYLCVVEINGKKFSEKVVKMEW